MTRARHGLDMTFELTLTVDPAVLTQLIGHAPYDDDQAHDAIATDIREAVRDVLIDYTAHPYVLDADVQ